MPANQKKQRTVSKVNTQAFDFDDVDAEIEDQTNKENAAPKSRRRVPIKNPMIEEEESDSQEDNRQSCDNEMQGLLNSFGADITRNLASKRKRLQSFTQASLKASNRKYEEIFKKQSETRTTLCEEFSKQIASVFNQWETDVQKARENEEKVETLLRQQQKTIQQQRVIQGQRLKSLKQLFDQYVKSASELETVQLEQQTNVNGELKQELASLQKKIMMDTKQEEIMSVKKSLQTMLAQV